MHLPTIRQLQYLLAVVELRHFGQAAERCFVTQSTLSTGVQELENMLGAKLLERTKRKVNPTPLGQELAERARTILELSSQLVEVAQSDKEPLAGPLKLGVIPTISPFLLPQVLPVLREQYPKLKLYLVEDQSARLVERLATGEIDAAVLAFPFELGKLEYKSFWSEQFWVAFPKGHPLSEGGPIHAADLPADELMLLEEGHCFRDHALSACHRGDLVNHSAFQGTSLYTLIEMVAGGQGITFLPQMAINTSLTQREGLSLRPLAEAAPHREVGLVWRSTYHRKHDLELLGQCMAELMSRLAAEPQGRTEVEGD